jgi:hypothetical protein
MTKQEILTYIKNKIPDYSSLSNKNKHIWQFCIHVYPFLFNGRTHWFIEHLVDALYEIESVVPGYTKMIIDKISTFAKAEAYQVFQYIGEVLVLRTLINLDGVDKSSIELEPKVQASSKNPEYRMKIYDKWYAFEVKTPDLVPFTEVRQNGLQLTSRLTIDERDYLSSNRDVIVSKDLKIQDYLKNADEKFSELKTKTEYEKDITVLIIIWDDYINEAISALKNPSSGLLTENSFYPDSQFENVDGVIVLRHQHHLKQMFYYGQPIIYSPQSNQAPNVFKLEDYDLTRGTYFNNSHTEKETEARIIKELDLYDFTDDFWMFTGEYQPTDMIDWNIGKGIHGLNYCSGTLRTKILSLFWEPPKHTFVTSKIVADFSVINLKRIIEMEESEERVLESVEQIKRGLPFRSLGPTLVWGINEIHAVNTKL